jgi:probable HAF family extracellular repeat protein
MVSRSGTIRLALWLTLVGTACADPAPTAPAAPRAGVGIGRLDVAATLSGHDFVTVDLGVLGTGTDLSSSIAHDINELGVVVGESSTPGTKTQGFIWSPTTGMTGLGFVSASDAFSRGSSINDNGWVAGTSGSRPHSGDRANHRSISSRPGRQGRRPR